MRKKNWSIDFKYPHGKFILAGSFLLSLVLNLAGSGAGLPQPAVKALLFSQEETLNRLTPTLVALRKKIYASYAAHGTTVFFNYYDGGIDIVPVEIAPGKIRRVPEAVLNYMRGFLLRSEWPDEQLVIGSLSMMHPERRDFNPHFFQYGGGYLYFVAGILKFASLLGILKLTPDTGFYLSQPQQSALIYQIPRIAGGIIASLAIFPLFFSLRKLFDEAAAALATIFFSAAPVFMVESHILKPFGYDLFFLALGLYFLARLEEGRGVNMAAAGLSAGLSTGILYLSGFLLFGLLAFCAAAPPFKRRRHSVAIILACFAAGFLAVNPYLLPSLKEFIREMSGRQIGLFGPPSLQAVTAGADALGWPLWILSWIGLFFVLNQRPLRTVTFAFCAMYLCACLIFACIRTNPAHYGTPLFFMSVAFAGRGATALFDSTKRWFATSIAVLTFSAAFLSSVAYAGLFTSKDPYYQAGAWMNAHLHDGASIKLENAVECFSPPFQSLRYQEEFTESPSAHDPEFLVASDLPDRLAFDIPYSKMAQFERRGLLRKVFPTPLYPPLNCAVAVFKRR